MNELPLSVDREACVGHARCYSMHPDLFSADALGHAVAVEPAIGFEDLEDAQDAVENCPEGAIRLGTSMD
jgi:ferredoxin